MDAGISAALITAGGVIGGAIVGSLATRTTRKAATLAARNEQDIRVLEFSMDYLIRVKDEAIEEADRLRDELRRVRDEHDDLRQD